MQRPDCNVYRIPGRKGICSRGVSFGPSSRGRSGDPLQGGATPTLKIRRRDRQHPEAERAEDPEVTLPRAARTRSSAAPAPRSGRSPPTGCCGTHRERRVLHANWLLSRRYRQPGDLPLAGDQPSPEHPHCQEQQAPRAGPAHDKGARHEVIRPIALRRWHPEAAWVGGASARRGPTAAMAATAGA